MKDYYQILGVSRSAPIAEIKRAYRVLAVRYHPDKNPDPHAASQFYEINEAYETLSDISLRNEYDQRLASPWADKVVVEAQPVRKHRDPAYRPNVRRKGNVAEQRERLVKAMWVAAPFLKKVVFVALCFGALITIDLFLPTKDTAEKIITASILEGKVGRVQTRLVELITDKEHIIEISDLYVKQFKPGMIVKFSKSSIMGIPVSLTSETQYLKLRKNIYSNFIFAPLIMFVAAVVAWYNRREVEIAFNAGVVTTFFLLLTLIFYFWNL